MDSDDGNLKSNDLSQVNEAEESGYILPENRKKKYKKRCRLFTEEQTKFIFKRFGNFIKVLKLLGMV